MKTIGILGCGWLGLPLAQNLIEKGYTVKGTTTSLDKLKYFEEQGIDPYLLDLYTDDYSAVLNTFLNGIDTLIITIPPFRNEDTPTYALNFKKLIEPIETQQIKNVIMMSSVSVYAPSSVTITEQCTEYSQEATAQQILAAEQVLMSNSHFTTCVLRLGGLYGHNRKPVEYICKKAFLDNPDMPINMIHLEDIIAYTVAMVIKPVAQTAIYNIVSPSFKSRLDYYSQQAKENNLTLPPLGENDKASYRKITGNLISEVTEIPYRY